MVCYFEELLPLSNARRETTSYTIIETQPLLTATLGVAGCVVGDEGTEADELPGEELDARWEKELPEALECLTNGFAAATRYFAFPKQHWKKIRSTNGLERLHGEIKRRTRAVGAFPDRASALRLITAVVIHATQKWDDRRYLDMTLLNSNEVIQKAA